MLRSIAAKVAWMARATTTVVGLAIMLALVFGVATTALGANGGNFILGQTNTATALTRLTGDVQGSAMQIINNHPGSDDSALNLQVDGGEAPMRTSSDTKVNNLNADKVDGLGAEEIGVNGLERVLVNSSVDSDSGKEVTARCPDGKVLVGSGYTVAGGKTGLFPDQMADVVVTVVNPLATSVFVKANEIPPGTADNWSVIAHAVCATAP